MMCSVIIPVFNERDSVRVMHQALMFSAVIRRVALPASPRGGIGTFACSIAGGRGIDRGLSTH
jgi:hypothetical protein